MSEPEQVLTNVTNLMTAVGNLEKLLAPLLDQSLEVIAKQLTPLDAAKLYSTVAYALSSLEVSYLRLNGIDHTRHNIMGDLKRVQESMGRLTATAKMLQAVAEQEKEEKIKQEQLQQKEQQQQQQHDDNTMGDNDQATASTPSSGNYTAPPQKGKKRKA